MNFRLLRRSSVALLVGAVLATSARAAIISNISDPIQYDATHYYAYAVFDVAVDWTTANALASTLAPYAGLEASLATFETEGQYSWFVANEGNFTSPSIGSWDIAWVGAVNNGSDSYEWINGGGAIAPGSTHWDTTWNPPQPAAGNFGVVMMVGGAGGYGDVLQTRPVGEDTIGHAIIMWSPSPVPEPGTVGLALVGLAAFALRRRRRSES